MEGVATTVTPLRRTRSTCYRTCLRKMRVDAVIILVSKLCAKGIFMYFSCDLKCRSELHFFHVRANFEFVSNMRTVTFLKIKIS